MEVVPWAIVKYRAHGHDGGVLFFAASEVALVKAGNPSYFVHYYLALLCVSKCLFFGNAAVEGQWCQ